MAILHAVPGEVMDVRPLRAVIATTTTRTLVKTKAIDVIRLVLPAGRYCKKLWMEVFQAAVTWGLIPSMN
jgi:hypothetical protein